MKVLQINAVYGISSTGRTTKELDEALTAAGHESLVAVTKTNTKRDGRYIIGNKLDWKIHGLLSRLAGKQGYFSHVPTKKLLRYIKQEKPDIVHLRNLHGNYIHVPMLLKYLAKHDIATVITLHDCWFFTGKCTHYVDASCAKWQEGCSKCPKLKADNKSWLFDRTKKMWNDKKRLFEAIPRLAVVGVSNWTEQEARRSFLNTACVIKRIYNWIDLNAFYPRTENVKGKYHIPEDKFLILAISAGWSQQSDRFCDVLRLSDMLTEDMHIVMVGKGIEDITLPTNITKVNYIDGVDELAKLYSNADVYVHFSRKDTFGKVVAENLACGTPAIVYDSTALPELVQNHCGYVVPVGDVEGIFKKARLIQQTGKEHYSEVCAQTVQRNFSKEQLTKEYIDLYKGMIS